MFGELVLLVSQLSFATALVLQKKVVGAVDTYLLALWFHAAGVVLLLPAITRGVGDIRANLPILAAAAFVQILGFVLYLTGLKMTSAPRASMMYLALPLFVSVLSIAFLGEQLNARLVASFALMAAGLLVLVY